MASSLTVREAIQLLAEDLEIDIVDGNLSEEHREIVAKALEDVRREVDERGYVESNLTPEQLDMPWDDFVAVIVRRSKQN